MWRPYYKKSIACVSNVNKDEQLYHCEHSTATCVDKGNLESSAAYSAIYGLYQDKETHIIEEPHKCTQCHAAFARADALRRHNLVHTGEKPHTCTLCSAAFLRAYDLGQQKLVHTGEKPHKCTQCSAVFAEASKLK